MSHWQPRPVATLRADRPELLQTPFGNQIEAIALGNAPGSAWEAPGALYIWDGRFSHYLWSSSEVAFGELFEETVLPEAVGLGFDAAKFYLAGAASSPVPCEITPRVRLMASKPVTVPSGEGKVKPIVATTFEQFPEIAEEVEGMWGDPDRFLARGFGYFVQIQDICVSWCTAEYRTGDSCAVGVATDPSFQRQGFAMRAAASLVNRAVKDGLRVYWDTWTHNEASLALARKLGFSEAEEYAVGFADLA